MTAYLSPSFPPIVIDPKLAAATAALDTAFANFRKAMCLASDRLMREWAAGLEAIRGTCEHAAEGLRKVLATFAVRDVRRVLWTGIARRHTERPPTRGYWLRRCGCQPCRERKGLAGARSCNEARSRSGP